LESDDSDDDEVDEYSTSPALLCSITPSPILADSGATHVLLRESVLPSLSHLMRLQGKARKGKESKGKVRKRKGKERKGKERKRKERKVKGRKRKGKERKGKERKGKETKR
jgi:hypothetical protein